MAERCGHRFLARGSQELGIPDQLLEPCELEVGHAGRHKWRNATWGEPAALASPGGEGLPDVVTVLNDLNSNWAVCRNTRSFLEAQPSEYWKKFDAAMGAAFQLQVAMMKRASHPAQKTLEREYPHLVICSGDRRFPAGEPGHSCCCLNIDIQNPARSARAEAAQKTAGEQGMPAYLYECLTCGTSKEVETLGQAQEECRKHSAATTLTAGHYTSYKAIRLKPGQVFGLTPERVQQSSEVRGTGQGHRPSSTEARRESPLSSVNNGEGGSPIGQTPTSISNEIVEGLENRGYMDLQFNRDDAAAAREFISEIIQEFVSDQRAAPQLAEGERLRELSEKWQRELNVMKGIGYPAHHSMLQRWIDELHAALRGSGA